MEYRPLTSGGLIAAHHNELRDGVSNLANKAFTPTHVSNNPKICKGRAVLEGKEKLKGSPSKDEGNMKGTLLVRYLWTQGTDSTYDMHVVNTETTSYQSKSLEKCLKTSDKAKKR